MYTKKFSNLPDGWIHPEGEGPLCLGGAGMRDGGMSLSTNLYSPVDSMTLPAPSDLSSTWKRQQNHPLKHFIISSV